MKKVVEFKILGKSLVVKSDEDMEHISLVEDFIEEKVNEVKSSTNTVSTIDTALLALLNTAYECITLKEKLETVEKSMEEMSEKIDRRTL